MAIKINFPATVVTLLLLVELTTCALSTADGNISNTTPQNGWTITSTLSQKSWNSTTGTFENSSSTSTKSPSDSQQRPSADRSSEPSTTTGLRVLYRMTSTWLDVIQPPGKNLYDELQMESALADKPDQPLEAISQSFSSKARNDPKYFIRYWVGFAVCIAFGVLFIVLMPIVGLSVCLCRCCCHRCGHEKTGTPEKSRDKPKRICLGIFLFFFAIIILAGTVCAFMSNELVRQQTTSGNSAERDGGGGGSLLSTVLRNLGEVDAFKQATVKEVDNLLIKMNSTLYGEIDKLKGLPDKADDRLRSVIGTDLVGNISTLNQTLFQLVEALRMVDADSEQLRNLYSELNQSLTTIQSNLTTLCHADNMTLCNPPDLTKGLSDPSQMPNISSKLTSIKSIVGQGINVSVFEDVSRRIRKELQSVLDAVSRFDISGTLMNISSSVKSAADSLDLQPLVDGVNKTKADVDRYGSYRFNVCVAISSLLLLIVLLIFIGLCIGVCSNPPYDLDSASGVTRWTAAQFLMASVVIMFIFCSVLMAIVTVLFVSGGIIYTDGCRGFDQQQNNALVKIADSLLRTQLGNVSLYGILRDCKKDDGIVKALNLDEKFQIGDRFNLSKLRDLDIRNRINLSSIDLSQFQLNGSKTLLENLRNSSITNINFTAFNEMLNETRLRSTLNEAKNDLNATAHNTTDTRLASGLQDIVQQLQRLSETIVVEIANKTKHLRIALKQLNETLYVENSTKTLTEFLTDIEALLERTENRAKNEAPRALQQLVINVASNVMSTIKKEVEDARTKVLTRVGGCSPIANAVENTVAAVCHSTLDPYNAFWFSYGWCVFLFIPTIAIAVVLAQLCWRIDMPLQSYSDVSGYDAYKSTYPEEYLRLHNLTTAQQDPRRQPDVNGANREPVDSAQPRGPDARATSVQDPAYATNPGYVDYGDNDQGNRATYPANNGIDFYRGVGGRHGNGSYDNPTYSDNDSNSYRIPRPTTAHARSNDDETNRWQF